MQPSHHQQYPALSPIEAIIVEPQAHRALPAYRHQLPHHCPETSEFLLNYSGRFVALLTQMFQMTQ
jgi:hypothetical protein